MKINVIGTSGSGKSTLGKRLADKLNVPYIEMDQVYWEADWHEPEDDVFFPRLEAALDCDEWVLDGNYTRTTPIKWADVDTVIWVDYGFARTCWQAFKRAMQRAISQEELWPGTGNRETFRQLFTRDSILLWTLKTYHKNRQKYLATMADARYAHIQFVHLRCPKDVDAYVASIPITKK